MIRTLAVTILASGPARLLSLLATGQPHPLVLAAMVIELAVPVPDQHVVAGTGRRRVRTCSGVICRCIGELGWSAGMGESARLDPRAPGSSAPVVLFDFDGVLIRGDSYEHFIRRELQGSRPRLAMLLPVIAVAIPMLKATALRRHGQRLMVRFAFLGWSASRFEASAGRFGRQLAVDRSLVMGDAVVALRHHLSDGARVVVTTQSAGAVVRAVLNEWGLETVELVASTPTLGKLGMRSAMHVHGAEKVRALAALGVRPPWEVAYSDSLSDVPLLAGAKHPVLVTADARVRAKAREILGPRLSVVTWR
jgi:phosphatidylglycerophosphatase C